LTTIHGFSSPRIMPVYEKYRDGYFVSISDSDRAPGLNYLATVYNGIDLALYPLRKTGEMLSSLSAAFIQTRVFTWRSKLPAKVAAGCSSPASCRMHRTSEDEIQPHLDDQQSVTWARWAWRRRMPCSLRLSRCFT
jgi:hypothetical protein